MTTKTTILQIIDGSGWLQYAYGERVSESGYRTMTHERLLALALVERVDDGEEDDPWREVVGLTRPFGDDDFVDGTDLAPASECEMTGHRGECPGHDVYVGQRPKGAAAETPA